MKRDIPIRITVLRPPPGVVMKVQRGSHEFLSPTKVSEGAIEFNFDITVSLDEAVPNFLGKYAQGPKSDRFIYVNSGRRAGEHLSAWDRRAKISLMTITGLQIQAVLAEDGSCLHAEYNGTDRNGGPTCASVKGIEWKVVSR